MKITSPTFPAESRILLVEDNPINQELILCILESLELRTDTANNGIEALEALRSSTQENQYHIIVMDCQMPEMDGYAASIAIRSGDAGTKYLKTPIIAMTAHVLERDKERCSNAGMNDYLRKPVEDQALIEILKKHLLTSSSQK